MFEQIKAKAQDEYIPIIREQSGKKLYDLCKQYKPKSILEIGTAIGYSGSIMLSAYNQTVLTTMEKDEKRYNEAVRNFEKGGFGGRVNAILDDALNVLSHLVENNFKFDFIFLDGPKGQYARYLPYLKSLLNSGGVLFADNIYFKGLVLSQEKIPHKHRTIVNNLRQFINMIKQDRDFNTEFYEIEDGFSISILK